MNCVGRKRRIPDSTVAKVKAWKPLAQLAVDLGLKPRTARFIRRYHFKQASPNG